MRDFLKNNIASLGLVTFFLILVTALSVFSSWDGDGRRTFGGNISEKTICEGLEKLKTSTKDVAGINVPQDAGSGCEPTELAQIGASVYYDVDVSTPGAFYGSVNGRGFNEGYGYQCVAGFKEFMFALSGRYVATNTGGASGYAAQQAHIEPLGFKWHSGTAGLQDGDWGIFTNGQYGHVAMYYQGKWFGQNQGAANAVTGNPFNLLALGITPVGFYRPNIYQKAAPTQPKESAQVTPDQAAPQAPVASANYTTKRGDTLGGIALKNGWYGGVNGLYGNTGYTQRLAEQNGIEWRGLIYPGQTIKKLE